MAHCPRRLATTSLRMKTKGAGAGLPSECTREAKALLPRCAQSVVHAAIGCFNREMERILLLTTTAWCEVSELQALCEASELQGRSLLVEANGWCD